MISEYPFKKITDGIYEISEYYDSSIYLVEGPERALVIDTGVGLGNLPAFLRTLTDRPMDVFVTHNHRDHIGNAGLFPHINISEIDTKIGPILYPVATRMAYANGLRMRSQPDAEPWPESEFTAFTEADMPEIRMLSDGDTIDLGGGRILTAYLCPGHSPGSMVLLDAETGILFCGDVIGGNVGLGVRAFPNVVHPSMEDTLASMQRIDALPFDHSNIRNGHAIPELRPLGSAVPREVLPNLMRLMEDVIEGRAQVHQSYIANLHMTVDSTADYGVRLEFHEDQVHGKDRMRILEGVPAAMGY